MKKQLSLQELTALDAAAIDHVSGGLALPPGQFPLGIIVNFPLPGPLDPFDPRIGIPLPGPRPIVLL
jgi:hypothetical protein